MVKLINERVYLTKNDTFVPESEAAANHLPAAEEAVKRTMAYKILTAHNTSGDDKKLKIKFDAMASHDITYVGIIQTARASGLREFPVPYVLTNCHNSLCAVGGTINEDDHVFGLSAAKKYGGIFVPAHQSVIHSYMREMMSGCGKMILGSDSHTRYGALGTMAIGEGGPELVKQLVCRTYDIPMPEVIAVRLTGKVRPGVGPHDVALAIIGAVFESGFVKNKVLEFVGDGIASLSADFRCGIDVMTTETTCLSSIWKTDAVIENYFKVHGRPEEYKELSPEDGALYSGAVDVDLSKIESMIALPFHPSNVYTIRELKANAADILRQVEIDGTEKLELKEGQFRLTDKIRSGGILADQGVIAGCAGGAFENLCAAADIIGSGDIGCGEFGLSAYPASQPVFSALLENGVASRLVDAGVTMRTAFCGPCFGAGDVPANGGLSLRHSTRNFPNREGSKPANGQIASVALMDARSIAATAVNGGYITGADELACEIADYPYSFNEKIYARRVYNGWGKADKEAELKYGPNIADWPKMPALPENVLLRVDSVITDPVTTTDELIPSGETSSYRSNPMLLSRYALSRKDPDYVEHADETSAMRDEYAAGEAPSGIFGAALKAFADATEITLDPANTGLGSVVCSIRPGDGSAREQAASCQRVLGGLANLCNEYATKRYRSNLINWGMLPLTLGDGGMEELAPTVGDFILIPGARTLVASGASEITAYLYHSRLGGVVEKFTMPFAPLTDDERKIILAGCLSNFYREENEKN